MCENLGGLISSLNKTLNKWVDKTDFPLKKCCSIEQFNFYLLFHLNLQDISAEGIKAPKLCGWG